MSPVAIEEPKLPERIGAYRILERIGDGGFGVVYRAEQREPVRRIVALKVLRAGRIDFFVHDAPTIWTIAGSLEQRDLHGLYRPLTKEALAWAVRREDEPLRAALDASIAQWQEEGAIDPIVQRWIPVRVTQR